MWIAEVKVSLVPFCQNIDHKIVLGVFEHRENECRLQVEFDQPISLRLYFQLEVIARFGSHLVSVESSSIVSR